MRTVVLTIGVLALLLLVNVTSHDAASASRSFAGGGVLQASALDVLQDVPKAPTINIEVNKGGGRQWYANPLWIAIGVLGSLIVVVLIVMAAKGGGTTVLKG